MAAEGVTNEDEIGRRRASCASSSHSYTSKIPEVPVLSALDAEAARLRNELILIDVRTEGERAVSMLPGALTAEEFESQYQTSDGTAAAAAAAWALPANTIVAPYCTVGYRSGLYARDKLLKSGVPASQVFNHEGILMHTYLGHPLEKRAIASNDSTNQTPAQTFEVHTYAFPWSGLANPLFTERYYSSADLMYSTCKKTCEIM